jgi:hypothetical protein
MARASIALSVGAAKLTKMRGVFGLAKIRSSELEMPSTQTIEYKDFGGEKARKMAQMVSAARGKNPRRQGTIHVSHYD